MKAALKKLGFADVRDSAEAAALATGEYVKLLEQGEMENIITSACPSIVDLIEIHYPELIPYMAPVLLPSGIHTRMLKASYGEEAKVVFAGPCIAEKKKSRAVAPDAVLTFEEIRDWLSEEGIEIPACEEEAFEERHLGANLRYPVSGGLLTAVEETTFWISIRFGISRTSFCLEKLILTLFPAVTGRILLFSIDVSPLFSFSDFWAY